MKVLAHIRGAAFTNPPAGEYPVRAEVRSAPGAAPRAAAGTASILDAPPKARLAPTNFLLPRGGNANFQTVAVDRPAPALLTLLLWRDGKPLDGVGVLPADPAGHPRYTGGLLVRDANGDGALSLPADEVVGGIIGAAPAGAKGQAATSPAGADGRPILSGSLYGYGAIARVPGLLPVRFRAGDKPGAYRPTFELDGGNAIEYTVLAVQP